MPSTLTLRNGEQLQFEASAHRPPTMRGRGDVQLHGGIGMLLDIEETIFLECLRRRKCVPYFVSFEAWDQEIFNKET